MTSPTPPDIAAAAETVQGFLADPGSILTPDDIELNGDIIDAIEVVLDAYLSLTATPEPARLDDGDVAVDEAWLKSVGCIREDSPPIKWTFRREDALDIGFWCVDDGWKAMLIHHESAASCMVRGLKTRGQVRKLLESLGVPLAAPGEGAGHEN